MQRFKKYEIGPNTQEALIKAISIVLARDDVRDELSGPEVIYLHAFLERVEEKAEEV